MKEQKEYKYRYIRADDEIITEMEVILNKLGFTKTSEFFRVWWKNPVEIGRLIEKAREEMKEEIEKEIEKRKRKELLDKQAQELPEDDDIEPFPVE